MSRGRSGALVDSPILERGRADGLVIDLEGIGETFDKVDVFGREAPLDIDFGAGKGHFLCVYAEANPDRDVIAVERARPFHLKEVERVGKRCLSNVRCLYGTGEKLLERFGEASISRFFVFHPDPWPKTRHLRRRFVQTAHLEALAPKLEADGLVVIQTDHDGYAEWMVDHIAATSSYDSLDPEPFFAELPPSGFERKHRALGKTIHRFLLRRSS